MSERLDLSGVKWSAENKCYFDKGDGRFLFRRKPHTPATVLREALRAQASEDAKTAELAEARERVRVLESYLRDLADGLHANTPFWDEVKKALGGGKESGNA
jgi:hypothetical protein